MTQKAKDALTARDTSRAPMRMYPIVRALVIATLVLGSLSCLYACFTQDYIDAFYMVTSGNWMLDHRTPETLNGSSPITMGVVSQNWLFCLFTALCYRASTLMGIGWYGMACMTALMCAACIAYLISIARRMTGGSRTAGVLTVFLMLLFIKLTAFRSHALVLAMTAYCLWANRHYLDAYDWNPLLPIPLLTMVHVNVQAATALTEPLACLGYALTLLVFSPHERRRCLPPLLVAGASCMATLVTPYGISATLYALINAGVDGYKNYVSEMSSPIYFALSGDPTQLIYLVVPGVATALALGAQWHCKRIHILEDLMALAGVAAVTLALRNALYANLLSWWLCIVSWVEIRAFVLSCVQSATLDQALRLGSHWRRSLATYLAYITVLGILLLRLVPVIISPPTVLTDSQRSSGLLFREVAPVEASDYILADHPDSSRPHVLAYAPFGSYLEFRGCVVSCTSRWEIWEPAISGVDHHLFFDTADSMCDLTDEGDGALQRLLALDDWDYLLLRLGPDQTINQRLTERVRSTGLFQEVFVEELGGGLEAVVYKRVDGLSVSS